MSQSATSRFGLRPAPSGLALVQEFLNTRGIEGYGLDDLLASPSAAQAWARDALDQWSRDRDARAPQIALSPADLRELRALRSTFARLVGGSDDLAGASGDRPMPVSATVIPSPEGTVEMAPAGNDWRWFASALWIEAFRAQQDGTWGRLKLCRNTECASAFYDVSRNNSGVWHDVRTCGNVANLRASRERKRAREASAGQ